MIYYELKISIMHTNEVHIDRVSVAELGYTDEEWNDLSGHAKGRVLDAEWYKWSSNLIDGGYHLVK